jgi:hypothetical protein
LVQAIATAATKNVSVLSDGKDILLIPAPTNQVRMIDLDPKASKHKQLRPKHLLNTTTSGGGNPNQDTGSKFIVVEDADTIFREEE